MERGCLLVDGNAPRGYLAGWRSGVGSGDERFERTAAPSQAEELERLAENWRPHRAVAARMLWQYYLGKQAR